MTGGLHVVAVSARTPLGLTAESSVAAVRAGISRITEHPFIIDRMAQPVRMAQDKRLDPGLMGPERLLQMLVMTLEELCEKLAPVQARFRNIPLFLGLSEARPGWSDEDVRVLHAGLARTHLPVQFQPIEVFSRGHAAGLLALAAASTRIRAGQPEPCAVAGVDSYLGLESLEWLDLNRQLATAAHRGAFFPGEGAGAFVVAPEDFVRRHGLNSLAVIQGVGTATEGRLIKTEAICLGEGLTECIRKAVTTLRLPAEAVEGIICDINGERYRSQEWGFAALRLADAFLDPTGYELPAACWGDMGAASGPLFVAMVIAAGRRGWAKGRRYLIWNSSEGGDRAAAVLGLPAEGQGVPR